MDALFEPIALFRDELREKHARATEELFDKLAAQAAVDPEANAATVARLRRLEADLAVAQKRLARWNAFRKFLAVLGWLLVVVLVGILILLYVKGSLRPKVDALQKAVDALQARRDAAEQEAWAQMAPLNRLFDWQMPARLAAAAAPIIQADPFFTEGRLADLRRTFGWTDSILGPPDARSILYSQSGEINGNPFVVGRALCRDWVQKTYTGRITISWTAMVPDGKGGVRSQTRHQVLTASVAKPAPSYDQGSFLLSGNEAAPNRTVSRTPSPLSAEDPSTRAGRRHLATAVKKLEKFSRNLDDKYPFTLMPNHDFEALFGATDRDNEIQFRLLYTPLAQTQTLAILRDRSVGYGDDFTFRKHLKVNCLQPAHLDAFDMDADPARYRTCEFAETRHRFLSYNTDYFRHLYFALAPLLAVPLYQQTRTHETIWRTRADRASAPWEHESFANHIGAASFAPAAAITPCILKATPRAPDADAYASPADPPPAGTRQIDVVAHAFRGEDRVDEVPVWGGDGRRHLVPVHWTKYIPVSRTRTLTVRDAEGVTLPDFETYRSLPPDPTWADFFRRSLSAPYFRRSIAATFR